MKLNFEKIFFYFMLVIVSGSIGYAIKPVEQVDQKELEKKYQNQQQVCTAAIHMMQDFSKKNYYKPKTKKELAIERMMSR
jgi:ABC-type cobalamin transport system ATPase subunit